ncbi:flagellin N-terminal helical domain-containing protein [Vreelandella venusta]|uniref:flagellin N-terminal helical domain-containing protein n=1 Tax=Vreelandella venusta TaxID=44935 RepID=UPI003C2F9C04
MSVINTNITSMIGQQNLSKSQNALTTSMERLSSGLRINSAKDDAAGQAIANRMSAQITGLATAQRNANDGISVAQTAEGALNQVNDNLQRIRELAVQAENGTNSQDDLDSIQNEINQRLSEINRISDETSFNDTKVLQSDQGMKIQVGANDGEAITIDLKEINVKSLNLEGFNVTGAGEIANEAAKEDDLKLAANVSVSAGPGDYTLEEENSSVNASQFFELLDNGATATLASTDNTGLQDEAGSDITYAGLGALTYSEANDNFTFGATVNSGSFKDKLLPSAAEGTREATITVSGEDTAVVVDSSGNITNTNGEALYFDDQGNITTTDTGTTAAATVDNLAALMSADTSGTVAGLNMAGDAGAFATMSIELEDGSAYAGTATATEIAATNVVMSRDDVQNILSNGGGSVTLAAAINVDAGTEDTFDFDVSGDELVIEENTGGTALRFSDADDIAGSLTVNENTETELYVRADNEGIITDTDGVQYFVDQEGNLTTDSVTEAERSSLGELDSALATVDGLRSDLGAIQNRMESAIENLSTTETNLSAARSRIEDADYAVEVANMTRAQILQQAGTSVLAQANQIPQSVLSLLG